jgi:hypothetical protein
MSSTSAAKVRRREGSEGARARWRGADGHWRCCGVAVGRSARRDPATAGPEVEQLSVTARHDAGSACRATQYCRGDPLLQGVDRFVLSPSQSAIGQTGITGAGPRSRPQPGLSEVVVDRCRETDVPCCHFLASWGCPGGCPVLEWRGTDVLLSLSRQSSRLSPGARPRTGEKLTDCWLRRQPSAPSAPDAIRRSGTRRVPCNDGDQSSATRTSGYDLV